MCECGATEFDYFCAFKDGLGAECRFSEYGCTNQACSNHRASQFVYVYIAHRGPPHDDSETGPNNDRPSD